MFTDKRTQLIELGPEVLADLLLDLSDKHPPIDDLIERFLATPDENVKRYKTKLASLKRSQRFISWGETGAFANELCELLDYLKKGIREPCLGVELVGKFFEADEAFFNRCDDSNGSLGDVFRYSAADLFVVFASQCADKAKISELVIKLNRNDEYGVRDCLFDRASEYLTINDLRSMIEQLWHEAEHVAKDYHRSANFRAIQSLAKQLKDAPLYEQARLADGVASVAAWTEIARVYLESGEPHIALDRLQQVSEQETFMFSDRQRIALAIYRQLGNQEAQTKIAWQLFKEYRDLTTFDQLLDVIGHEHREQVLIDEMAIIFQEPRLSLQNATFMVSVEHIDDLERYLLQRVEQLNGDFYYQLLPLAEILEKNNRLLVSSLIYRALLDSILARALSKYYHHGIKYLKKLDQLALRVTDWQTWLPHADYLTLLREQHKRKSSFWSKY